MLLRQLIAEQLLNGRTQVHALQTGKTRTKLRIKQAVRAHTEHIQAREVLNRGVNNPLSIGQSIVNNAQILKRLRVNQVQLIFTLKLHQKSTRTVADALGTLSINSHRAGRRRQLLSGTTQTALSGDESRNRCGRGLQRNNIRNFDTVKGQLRGACGILFSCGTHALNPFPLPDSTCPYDGPNARVGARPSKHEPGRGGVPAKALRHSTRPSLKPRI